MIKSIGIAGVFHTSVHEERVFLKSRKGFVKLAMQTGASLTPVYVFGQSNLLSVLPGKGSILGSMLEQFSRRLRISLSLFFGDFWLPLPRAIPLLVVTGPSLPCMQLENPTEEQVDLKHAEFCKELVALFERHKRAYGWEEKQLILM